MESSSETTTWSLRLPVEKELIDYLVSLEHRSGFLSIKVPLLDLPPAVRKLSLKATKHDTEDRIQASGRNIIFAILLRAAGLEIQLDETVTHIADNFRSIAEAGWTPTDAEWRAKDPTQAFLFMHLGLALNAPKPKADLLLALRRLIDFRKSKAKEISKAAGTLLRAYPIAGTHLIAELFVLYDAETRRQLLARCERIKSPAIRQFLLERLAIEHNETYAEGIIAGLSPYQDLATLKAIVNYASENRSHSPRTLARIGRWLGEYPGEEAVQPLDKLLKSQVLQVAKAAGKALRQRGLSRAEILAKLAVQLNSGQLQQRAAAWAVLEDFNWSSAEDQENLWQQLLQNLKAHPDLGVKGIAPAILKYIPPVELVSRIKKGLNDSSDAVKAGMLFLVERLKNRDTRLIDETIILRIIPLLEHESFEVRRIVSHLLSSLLRQPLSEAITTALLEVYRSSKGKRERLLTIIGCWVVLFQYNDFDERVEQPLLESIASGSRSVLLAAWRLLRGSPNPDIKKALEDFRAAGKLKKA